MASTIAQAILEKFDAAGISDFAASGGLWLGAIPAGKPLPFAFYDMSEEQCEYTTEDSYIERGGVDFYVFALAPAEAERIAERVKTVFDACIKSPSTIDVDNSRVIDWERTGYRIGTEPMPDKEQRLVALATMSYRYAVNKELP